MKKTIYEDYKYCMQDVGNLYIGAKYTFDELLEQEDIPFKFRLVTQKYLMEDSDGEDTLETHLYYLGAKSFLVKIYGQLRAKAKVNVIEEKKNLSGEVKKQYVTKVMPIAQLSAMSVEEKEACGLVVQELMVSKFALMTF